LFSRVSYFRFNAILLHDSIKSANHLTAWANGHSAFIFSKLISCFLVLCIGDALGTKNNNNNSHFTKLSTPCVE